MAERVMARTSRPRNQHDLRGAARDLIVGVDAVSVAADRPTSGRPDNLFVPMSSDGGRRGRNWIGRTKRTSAYTFATLHPAATATVLAVGCALAGLFVRRS